VTAAKIVQKSPFMIPSNKVAMDMPQKDNVVCCILTYLYSNGAGGKLGTTKVMLIRIAKVIAKTVPAANILSPAISNLKTL